MDSDELDVLTDADAWTPTASNVAAVPRPRFCGRCGAAWDESWDACQGCVPTPAGPTLVVPSPDGGVRSALALYFTLLAISVVGIVAILAGTATVETEFVMLAGQVVFVAASCVTARRHVVPALVAPVRPWWFAVALGAAGCTFVVASAAVNGLHRLFGLNVLNYSQPVLGAGYGWAGVVVSVAVVPAVFEELAFRGVILSSLRRVLTDREAIAVSALMFMVLHLAVPSFPHLFLLGVVLAVLRLRSGSLLPGMLLHFTHNLLCVGGERFPALNLFH